MDTLDEQTASTLPKPKVNNYTVDPYSARVLILKLEEKYSITIRVHESNGYCMICVDKGARKDERD